MAVSFSEDFETDTSANWDGATRTVNDASNGFLIQTEDGLTVHQTQVTTGTQFWIRFGLNGTAWESNGGPCISDASGNGILFILDQQGANLQLEYADEYDTYTTYSANNDNPNSNIAAHSGGDEIGCFIDLTANTISFWVNVTADEPTDATTWDGVGADLVYNYGTAGLTQEGTYAGFGNWNTSGNTGNFTFFAAGTLATDPEPGVGSLDLTGQAPTAFRQDFVDPGEDTLTLTGLAPTAVTPVVVTPDAGSLAVTGAAPTADAGANITIEVPVGSLTVTGAAPSAEITHIRAVPQAVVVLTGIVPAPLVSDHLTRAPPAGSLALTGFAPSANTGASVTAEPATGSVTISGTDAEFTNSGDMRLILTTYAPQAVVSADIIVNPTTGSLTITGLAPSTGGAINVTPGVGSLTINGLAPSLFTEFAVAPGVDSLVISGQLPTVDVTENQITEPSAGSLVLSGLQPATAVSDNLAVDPLSGALTLTGLVPTIDIAVEGVRVPGVGSLALTGYAPLVSVSSGKRGGRSRRPRIRYVVEIDGEVIEVSSPQEAERLLAEVRDLVKEAASRIIKPQSVPRIRVRTVSGKIPTSKTVIEAARATQKTVRQVYQRANERARRDLEIARLLHEKIRDEDEEEAILTLLL